MSPSPSRQRPPSTPSTSSLNPSSSTRTSRRPPPISVITTPPWARDEPPSPTDNTDPAEPPKGLPERRLSDVASYDSTQPESRWWAFTLPRSRDRSVEPRDHELRPEKKGLKDRSISWLPTSSSIREMRDGAFLRRDRDKGPDTVDSLTGHNTNNPSLLLPSEPAATFTMAHSNTPGWSAPWTPRHNAQGPAIMRQDSYGFGEEEVAGEKDDSPASRRKKIRSFVLTNTYVPLLFRFINITFTGGALGMAIRIRHLEMKNSAMGAVGSSPTVVIIFAPLTLIHVIGAIYLEYFGRPLGLWRTSAKLAHTLSEVLFICAWSAALSLCFDNFFTSLIPCASESSTSWYNQLPRPPSSLPNFEGSVGNSICDDQLSLIGLVFVGLVAYCTNLIISLYRIFEKVKYHPQPAQRWTV